MRFQTKKHTLMVKKIGITGKNTFNEDYFENKDNHESIEELKTDL